MDYENERVLIVRIDHCNSYQGSIDVGKISERIDSVFYGKVVLTHDRAFRVLKRREDIEREDTSNT